MEFGGRFPELGFEHSGLGNGCTELRVRLGSWARAFGELGVLN